MVYMDSENKELKNNSDYAKTAAAVAPATTTTTTTTAPSTHDINSIILYPFAHQVGGHTQLLTLDKSTLCKPLIPRELLFYLNVPKELVKFVPSYKGVVQIRETGAGSYPPVVYQPLRSPKSPYAKYRPGSSCTLPAKLGARLMNRERANRRQPKKLSNISSDSDGGEGLDQPDGGISDDVDFDATLMPRFLHSPRIHDHSQKQPKHHHHHHPQTIITTDDDDEETDHYCVDRDMRSCSDENNSDHTNGGYFSEDSSQSITDLCGSPLELKVQIKQCSDERILKKNLSQDNLLKADYISRPNEKYLLLLENVASKYQLPCILDLKMGTRQHGDDATEEKRHRQIAKCQASTSASLGVRLCGMQVYQVDYGGFLWYDKYYGRKMDEEGLKSALHQYFHNGFQLNEDMIDDVIARLKLLSNAVEKSPSFRFYGTSLLIIHEGCTSRSLNRCPVDVRLIDFAHTICDYSNTNTRSVSSSSVLKSSSADQLTTPSAPMTQCSEPLPTPLAPAPPPTTQTHTQQQFTTPSINVNESLETNQQQQQKEVVDSPTVPHSLGGNRKTSKTSIGPDKGLLFGLENLMRLLDDLKNQYHSQEKRQLMEKAMENLYIPVI